MNILAIETSSELCSVALLAGGVIAEAEADAGQTHSQILLPMVAGVLRKRGIALRELDGIAFGAGPGSFTGLRIACGVAQGLAAGAGLELAGICTLEALAEEAWLDVAATAGVVACIDARMGEVYHAAYRRDGDAWRECSPPSLCAPDGIPALAGEDWAGAGSGFAAHGASLRSRQRLTALYPHLRPRARTIAKLAQARFAAGTASPAQSALPVYLRDKVALTSHERHPAT
jgi:tRNA threonylcarbamoyladenosine biosynthesis protein TsaB